MPPGEAGGAAPVGGGEGGAVDEEAGMAVAADPGTGGDERPATAPAENINIGHHTQQKYLFKKEL